MKLGRRRREGGGEVEKKRGEKGNKREEGVGKNPKYFSLFIDGSIPITIPL